MPLIPIYASVRQDSSFLGWTVAQCGYCDTLQPFHCFQIAGDAKIYGVTVSRYQPTTLQTICLFCNRLFAWPLDSEIPITAKWDPQSDLQALVDLVQPELGIIPRRTDYTDGEVYAILKQTDEEARTKIFGFGTLGFLLLTTILMAIACAVAATFVASKDEYVIFALMIGGVAGLICGYVLLNRYYRVGILVRHLPGACHRYGVSSDRLELVVTRYPDGDRGISAAVAKFRASARPN